MIPRWLQWVTLVTGSVACLAGGPARGDPEDPSPAAVDPLPWDTMADAYVIPSFPFTHDYSNVGYTRNYTYCCPYCYGPTPDVVYRYDPPAPVKVEISLCNPGTDYDTVMYLFRNGSLDVVACNDDACTSPDFGDPYVSRICSVELLPGNSYYLVVGGYSGQTGNYRLTIQERDGLHVVRADGTGEYATIQAAIDAACDGDVIELADGVYTGPGNRALTGGYRDLTLRSAGGDPERCILDCEEAARGFHFGNYVPPRLLIEGLTIRRGAAPGGAGGGADFGFNAQPHFRNCVFEGCRARLGAGVAIATGSPLFENCRFRQNWATESGGAIYAHSSAASVQARDCTFAGNKAVVSGGAICADSCSVPLLEGCTLTDNRVTGPGGQGGAIFGENWPTLHLDRSIVAWNQAPVGAGIFAGAVSAACCDFFGNVAGDWEGSPSQIGTNGNFSLDPLFCDFPDEDYHLRPESPCAPGSPQNPECGLIGAWPPLCEATTVEAAEPPGGPHLEVRPNPTGHGCLLTWSAAAGGAISAEIFDPAGRRVRSLTAAVDRGESALAWNQLDDLGRAVPSGTYLVRVRSAAGTATARVTILR